MAHAQFAHDAAGLLLLGLAVVAVEALFLCVPLKAFHGVRAEGEIADEGVVELELRHVDIHFRHTAVAVFGEGVGDAAVGVGVNAADDDGDGTGGGELLRVKREGAEGCDDGCEDVFC